MKKSYLMIAAAAALLTACAEKDTFKDVDTQDEVIGFNGAYVGKSTRADITKNYLEEQVAADNAYKAYHDFGVFGYKASDSNFGLFTNEKVSYIQIGSGEGAYWDWQHATVRFWDKSASYTFLAYAPYNAYGVTATATNGISFTGIPVITQIADNHHDDLVVSEAIVYQTYSACTDHSGITPSHISQHGTTNKYTYVPLTFKHILSKLTFKAKSSATSNSAKIRIKQIKIDFPTITTEGDVIEWAQALSNGTATGTTTIPALTAQDAVDTTTGAVVAENKFGFTVFDVDGNDRYGTNWLTTSAQDIVEWDWDDENTPAANNSDDPYTSEEYIVAPVEEGSGEGVTTGYDFAIKVVYDIQYYKEENNAWVEDGDPEMGCVATGIIPATVYQPKENQLWSIVIDVNPEQINFCVKAVNDWVDDFDNDGNVVEHYVTGIVQ